MQNDQSRLTEHLQDARWSVSPASADIEAKVSARTWVVWILAVLASLPIVSTMGSLVLMKYAMAHGVRATAFQGWTFADFVFAYYANAVILVAVILLVRMNWWAAVLFSFLFVRSVFHLVVTMPTFADPKYPWPLWIPAFLMFAVYAWAAGYCFYRRKDWLRERVK